jgi:predicted esterase
VARNSPYEQGRLRSRPELPPPSSAPVGLHALGVDPADGYLYVLAQLRGQANEAGLILLALGSRGSTWDLILNRGRYGPDIAAIDRALGHAFSRCAVDPAYVGVGGYSDGASYALSLGLANGDLFSGVLAFSPGFLAPTGQTGSPHVFISHGTRDGWLPIDSCSRRIVPQLERAGYEVRYREFEGGHVVPPAVAREAAAWFANRG